MSLLALAPVRTSLSVILESPFLSRVEALLDSVLSGLFFLFSFLFSLFKCLCAHRWPSSSSLPSREGMGERERGRWGRGERRERESSFLAEEEVWYQKISVSLSALISVSFLRLT
jgi:hypothetical protein